MKDDTIMHVLFWAWALCVFILFGTAGTLWVIDWWRMRQFRQSTKRAIERDRATRR